MFTHILSNAKENMEKYFLSPTPRRLDLKTKSNQTRLPAGLIRATFIVNKTVNERIKAFAYWECLTVKQVVHAAFTEYLDGKM